MLEELHHKDTITVLRMRDRHRLSFDLLGAETELHDEFAGDRPSGLLRGLETPEAGRGFGRRRRGFRPPPLFPGGVFPPHPSPLLTWHAQLQLQLPPPPKARRRRHPP